MKAYIPESQLMRFISLAENKKELATSLANHFLSLALENNLIGCYKTIVKRLGINEEERFLAPRDAQQESTAKAVVDLKKHIVNLETNVIMWLSCSVHRAKSNHWQDSTLPIS